MLFNSWPFIFLFLPCLLLGLGAASSESRASLRCLILLAFSLVFYLLWSWQYFFLLLGLIIFNYCCGQAISAANCGRKILVCAILLNLLPLIWFKYSGFIVANLALLLDLDLRFTPPGLPPGISFYTFIQIAWLVSIHRRQFKPMRPVEHALFSCGFAWIISGPIIRQTELASQLRMLPAPLASNLAAGLTLFSLGLAKKCLLADSLAPGADAVFAAAENGWPISCSEAWLGSLSYTFQLYFDFSGYTDMALGAALLAGLRLPQNFNSPYKSTGIIEFWRRWHITLGIWLRDFLYIPLGGNRKGRARQYLNLFLTMLIGGIWHGAGWTFVLWGSLQGAMLAINHGFRATIAGRPVEKWLASLPGRIFCILCTFFLLNLCWVPFRAFSLDGALAVINAMFTPDSALFPHRYFSAWPAFALPPLCAAICWFMPNSNEITSGQSSLLAWRPTTAWATCLAILFFVSLILINRQTTFLYFQF